MKKVKQDYKKLWNKLKECLKSDINMGTINALDYAKAENYLDAADSQISVSVQQWVIDEMNSLEEDGELL